MRNAVLSTVLALLLSSYPAVQAGEPPLAERLEKLISRAAGVALAEVKKVEEADERGGDGNLYLEVSLQILRSSGVTFDTIRIVKEYGGNWRGAPKPRPYGPVNLDTFKQGERYWIAFCSRYDRERCPQGVVNAWPEKGGSGLFDEAVRAGHYAHRPQYHPEAGLTYSCRADKDKKIWRVRMERAGKLLWEVNLPDEMLKMKRDDKQSFPREVTRLVERLNGEEPDDLGLHLYKGESLTAPDDENRSGWVLQVDTVAHLEAGNEYKMSEGKYPLTYMLDAATGKTNAIWVTDRLDLYPMASPAVIHYFDGKTGKVLREERHDFQKTGGLAAGAKEEKWIRITVRTYDPGTGKLMTEEICTRNPESGKSKYIPVNK